MSCAQGHVVVTGAAGGLGRAIAARITSQAAAVTLVDSRPEALDGAVRAVQQVSDAEIHTEVVDLCDPEAVEPLIRRMWRIAPISVLINAAGVYPSVTVDELDAAAWARVLNINTSAPVLATAALGRLWGQTDEDSPGIRAVVVNVSSTAAGRSRPGALAYSASKAALESATKSAALELGPRGIRVTAVAPGFIAVDSPVNQIAEDYARLVDQNPLGRPGTPEDVADAVNWLIDDSSSWVTGTVITVDGGSSVGNRSLPLSG